MPDKSELRKSLRQARLATSAKRRAEASKEIRAKLREAVDWSKIESLHCFEPIEELGEVDVRDFIQNTPVFTSRRENDGNDWSIVSADGQSAVPEQFDAIIVPMLGFDDQLQRIGFGGGYYDRFLATQPRALKIGVCFEQGKINRVPAEPHDIPLDLIVTESAVYQR